MRAVRGLILQKPLKKDVNMIIVAIGCMEEMRMLILLKKLLARAIRFLLNWKCRLGLYQIKVTDDLRLWMNIFR